MTVTDLTYSRTRRRTRPTEMPQPEPTPESARVQDLAEMLADPRYAGYRAELEQARAELLALTATTALAA